MGKQSLRFTVTDGCGRRAASWHLWTHTGTGKHDVYLTCREWKGCIKTSLHQSGRWHAGFDRGFVKRGFEEGHPKRENPYIDLWPRPPEIAPGVTLAYRIVVPTAGVTAPIGKSELASLVSIPAAPPGKVIEILVFLLKSGVNGWPGSRSMGTKPVGELGLDNGDIVRVVYHVDDVPNWPPFQGKMNRFKQYAGKDLPTENIRAVAFADHEDGSRILYDTAVDMSAVKARQLGQQTS